ncbi:hypothetical protein R1flu_017101 [Riccia fluitans]|uniref:S-formylglutathione hydrolase n=1 Tax=Riccia fluitans TaxID=41844 RepID=A0ABD1YP45_9MARC
MERLIEIASNKQFDGFDKRYRYQSQTLGNNTTFTVYFSPAAAKKKILYYLSGLTCTDENVILKSGIQQPAAEKGIAIVALDTSPRGLNIEDEADSWDFGVVSANVFIVIDEEESNPDETTPDPSPTELEKEHHPIEAVNEGTENKETSFGDRQNQPILLTEETDQEEDSDIGSVAKTSRDPRHEETMAIIPDLNRLPEGSADQTPQEGSGEPDGRNKKEKKKGSTTQQTGEGFGKGQTGNHFQPAG